MSVVGQDLNAMTHKQRTKHWGRANNVPAESRNKDLAEVGTKSGRSRKSFSWVNVSHTFSEVQDLSIQQNPPLFQSRGSLFLLRTPASITISKKGLTLFMTFDFVKSVDVTSMTWWLWPRVMLTCTTLQGVWTPRRGQTKAKQIKYYLKIQKKDQKTDTLCWCYWDCRSASQWGWRALVGGWI